MRAKSKSPPKVDLEQWVIAKRAKAQEEYKIDLKQPAEIVMR